MLVPTCLHVALENRRFSDFWRFQEAFKISSFFVSNFYRFWLRLGLQHGAILGAKTPQNPKKWLQNFGMQLPESGSGYEPAFEERSRASWPRFWEGSGLDFRWFLADFSKLLGLLWACFRLLFLALVFGVLGQVFNQFCQENRRTCRGQSRESKNLPRTKPKKKIRTNAFRKTQISKLCSSKLPFLSQPSLLQKLWATVLPPRGASIRRPSRVGVFR